MSQESSKKVWNIKNYYSILIGISIVIPRNIFLFDLIILQKQNWTLLFRYAQDDSKKFWQEKSQIWMWLVWSKKHVHNHLKLLGGWMWEPAAVLPHFLFLVQISTFYSNKGTIKAFCNYFFKFSKLLKTMYGISALSYSNW